MDRFEHTIFSTRTLIQMIQVFSHTQTPVCTQTPDASLHWQVSGLSLQTDEREGGRDKLAFILFCSLAHVHLIAIHYSREEVRVRELLQRHCHRVSPDITFHTCPLESVKQCRNLKLHAFTCSDTFSLCVTLSVIENPMTCSTFQSLLLTFK